MAGTTIPLFTKRQVSFAASGTITQVKAVDVSQWTEGVILVRVHAHDVGTGSSIDVRARTTAPSADEPDTDFVNDASDVAKATVGTDSSIKLYSDAFSSDFGGALEIALVGTKGAGNCTATLSAELVVKA